MGVKSIPSKIGGNRKINWVSPLSSLSEPLTSLTRPVNEPNEHERGMFMFVCLSLNEHEHEHEHLIERKIMFVFVHLTHEDVRVRLCSFIKMLNERKRTQTNANEHKRTQNP
jgi:hypothetical protein